MATINRFIVHELIKNTEPDMAKVLLRLDNPLVLKLADDVVNVYKKKTAVMWGKFKNNGAFPLELQKLNKTDVSDAEFISLTDFVMQQLVLSMEHTSGTGGYICFIEYSSMKTHRLLVAMIKNTDGVKLTNLVPEEDIHVDISKLYQAIDINVLAYFASIGEGDVESYLGFISKQGEPSGYFNEAFSSTDNITPNKAVAKAPQALKAFLGQHTEDKAVLKSAHDTLVKYLSDSVGKKASLGKINDIANAHLPEGSADNAKDGFIEFAKSDAWQIPEYFQPPKGAVGRLAKITFTTDDISLNFNRNLLGVTGKESDKQKPVLYNPANDEVVLNKLTPEFIQLMKSELNIKDEPA